MDQTELTTTAIVGTGLAGVACARRLAGAGVPVQLFDRAPSPGGRMATHRRGPFEFDHGAQYFTARAAPFQACVAELSRAGVVARWPQSVAQLDRDGQPLGPPLRDSEARYVGIPEMSRVVAHLADGLPVRLNRPVTKITPGERGLSLTAAGGTELGHFGHVVLAMPAPQARPLVRCSQALARALSEVQLDPCIALMLAFEAPVAVSFDAAMVSHPAIAWLARNSSKPGRGQVETWVAHANEAWSTAHLEADPAEWQAELLAAFLALTGAPAPDHVEVRRFRHAKARGAMGVPFVSDPSLGLSVCGDACLGGRVEAAYLSGHALAGHLLGQQDDPA